MYYQRLDVRNAILNFARPSDGNEVRECAFYNSRTKCLQQYLNKDAETQRPIILDGASMDAALNIGASAFYCSCMRFREEKGSLHPIGEDIGWTIRALSGGLKFAKFVTTAMLDALSTVGYPDPWVKYSGELGFDVIIPLEEISSTKVSDDVRRELSGAIVDHLKKNFRSFKSKDEFSSLKLSDGTSTCLLSELRAGRGLLLAPMSLNPKSGLVSLPLHPKRIMKFRVFDASPNNEVGTWMPSPRVSHLITSPRINYPTLEQYLTPATGI